MRVEGKNYRGIELKDDLKTLQIIDQTLLPHRFVLKDLKTSDEVIFAISEMLVRGAPLIGVTAGFGMYLAALEAQTEKDFDAYINKKADQFRASRPTAVDLFKAVGLQFQNILKAGSVKEKVSAAFETANSINDQTIESCRLIGEYGVKLIEDISSNKKGGVVNILTHCNAGWLATVDYGTATAPIYRAFDKGIKVHVWVDETRPRNQGAALTTWELGKHGVPHTLIADNTGGHLMQHGMVDLVITGTDRITQNGDVANKIGTYLKALAAKDNGIPFYVAAPSNSIDFSLEDGIKNIPIEQRNPDEVKYVYGMEQDRFTKVLICPPKTPAANYGFDVTPARLVSGIITERGICKASKDGILGLFPEYI
jgi:methylthioribose-1-phosphate isomerase